MENEQKVIEMFATLSGLSLEEALKWEMLCKLSYSHLIKKRKEDVPLEDCIDRIIAAAAADAYYSYCLTMQNNSPDSFKVGDFSINTGSTKKSSIDFARIFRDEMLMRCCDCLIFDQFVFMQAPVAVLTTV